MADLVVVEVCHCTGPPPGSYGLPPTPIKCFTHKIYSFVPDISVSPL